MQVGAQDKSPIASQIINFVEMEPTNERLDEEIDFSTGLKEETKAVISFEDAWKWELRYRERIKIRSQRPSVGSEFPSASSQELTPITNVDGRKREAEIPSPPPLKREVSPSSSWPVGGEFRYRYMQAQQLQQQQAPVKQHQPSPHHLQNRSPRLSPSFQEPLLLLPKERTTLDFNYRQNSAKQTLGQQPQPRRLPNLQTLPKPLGDHLQSSLIPKSLLQQPSSQKPLLVLPAEEFKHQPRQSLYHQSMPWHDHMQSSSNQINTCWCDLCDVPCMGDFNYLQHCQGKKHKAKLEAAFGNSDEIEMKKPKVLWCRECGVPCMNKLAFAQHLAGRKHARRIFELRVRNAGSSEVAQFFQSKCE